jgi:type II secretory pathway pseudopilin PulG
VKVFRAAKKPGIFGGKESGVGLLETLVALALLGIIAASFLGGLATASKAAFTADERATAESLARSQVEYVKGLDYVYDAMEYSPAPIPGGEDYSNYSVTISAEPLHSPDEGIQKITVTIKHHDKEVFTLESYKVKR